LFVVDGSVIPGSLAANPTLTISAQAIKTVERAIGPLPI
jgi:choline dehydrogenase-like flavoprotein